MLWMKVASALEGLITPGFMALIYFSVVVICRDAVELLLKYEASANILDCKVCTPLHLAAWSGNADICRLLLQQGPSLARIHERVS